VVERDQKKRQLLDDISELREKLGRYRIEMEADYHARRFSHDMWQQNSRRWRVRLLPRSKSCHRKPKPTLTYRNRGNIPRPINTNMGGPLFPVLIDACSYDLDYLKEFIHDYGRGRERTK
jgi:hypothetical protein